MFDIVKDSYNEYNDTLKDVKLSDLSAIYIKPQKNSNFFYFFERYDDFWTYETVDGKFDYKIDNESTVAHLINQLKNTHDFDEDFIIRVYGYVDEGTADYIKLIVPGHRKLMNQEVFGNFELSRLREVNSKLFEGNDEEALQFNNQMDVVSTDVSQIVRLISAQAHTNETLQLTMRLVSQILANIPITAIDDEPYSIKDWVTYKQVEEDDSLVRKNVALDGYEIEEIYFNIRCTRIVKVIYKNIETSETETHYYDTHACVFIDPESHETYWSQNSIENVDLPWNFTPVKEIMISDDKMKEDMIKFSDAIK